MPDLVRRQRRQGALFDPATIGAGALERVCDQPGGADIAGVAPGQVLRS